MKFENFYPTIDTATIAQCIEWLNGDGKDATAEQAKKVENALNEKVTESNTQAQKERMDALFAMENADFWRTYSINPYYKGTKITNTPESGYQAQNADFRIKFKTLEKAYQDENTKTSTLCRYKQWDVAVALFNRYLQDDILADGKEVTKLVNSINKDKVSAAIKAMPECFATNTKQNRILMLKHICNLMCGEELGVKAMSFDVKYLKIAVARAKNGSIKTISDWALTDEIITVIGLAINLDENGKRKTQYDFSNKGGFAQKKSK